MIEIVVQGLDNGTSWLIDMAGLVVTKKTEARITNASGLLETLTLTPYNRSDTNFSVAPANTQLQVLIYSCNVRMLVLAISLPRRAIRLVTLLPSVPPGWMFARIASSGRGLTSL